MKNILIALICGLTACGVNTGLFTEHPTGSGGSSGSSSDTNVSSTSTVSSTSASGGSCNIVTCNDLGYTCGNWDNGCHKPLTCGTCDGPSFCGAIDYTGNFKQGVCATSGCGELLVDPKTSLPVSSLDTAYYSLVVECVCNTPATTAACGFNDGSQLMCNNHEVTWDFLTNNPIGPCVLQFCNANITKCEIGL